jgi:chemotaxis protein MotB
MARKREHSHADERWLLTYADMITLLMALFMVLFSIAVVNKGKFDELAKSLREAFNGPLDRGGSAVLNVGSDNPVQSANSELDATQATFALKQQAKAAKSAAVSRVVMQRAEALQAAQDRSLQDAKAAVDARARALGLQSQVHTEINERGLVIRLLTDKILFGLGATDVKPEAVPLLATIAAAIDQVPNPIRVEGHTDRVPYAGDRYGNWRLSVLRAVSVLEVLGDHGLHLAHREDVAPDGFGDTEPLVAYGDSLAQPLNRRVEIVVLRQDYVQQAEQAASGAIGSDPTGLASDGSTPYVQPIPSSDKPAG